MAAGSNFQRIYLICKLRNRGIMSKRKCVQIVRGQHAVDGAGVHLRRVLGLNTVEDFDPFLMLDGFDSTNPKDYIKGFPSERESKRPYFTSKILRTISATLGGMCE